MLITKKITVKKVVAKTVMYVCILFFYSYAIGMQQDFHTDTCGDQSMEVFPSMRATDQHDYDVHAVEIFVNSPRNQAYLPAEATNQDKQKSVFPPGISGPPTLNESGMPLGLSQKNLLSDGTDSSPRRKALSILSGDEEDILGEYFSEKLGSSGSSVKFAPRSSQSSLHSIPELPSKKKLTLTHYGDDDFIDTPGDHVFMGGKIEDDEIVKNMVLKYRHCAFDLTEEQSKEYCESYKEKNQKEFDEFVQLCRAAERAFYPKRGSKHFMKKEAKKETLEKELIIQILKIVAQGQQIKEKKLQEECNRLETDLAVSQTDCERAQSERRVENKKKKGAIAAAVAVFILAPSASIVWLYSSCG